MKRIAIIFLGASLAAPVLAGAASEPSSSAVSRPQITASAVELRKDLRARPEVSTDGPAVSAQRPGRQCPRPRPDEETLAKMKRLHEQYPDLKRGQLYAFVANPERLRKFQEFQKQHPGASFEDFQQALRERRLAKVKERHPDWTDAQIQKMFQEKREQRRAKRCSPNPGPQACGPGLRTEEHS